jgi:hypothetical protein
MNRSRAHEDTVDIRRYTDGEPEAKSLRGDVISKRPLPSEDTVHIRAQTETELEQKRPRREGEGMERAQRGASGDFGEVETAKGNPVNIGEAWAETEGDVVQRRIRFSRGAIASQKLS